MYRQSLGERLVDIGMGLMLISFSTFIFGIAYLVVTGQIESAVR